MTQKRKVFYPFLLGGITVYVLLFVLQGGSDFSYYRKIAQDLNPLIDPEDDQAHKIDRILLHHENLGPPRNVDISKAPDGVAPVVAHGVVSKHLMTVPVERPAKTGVINTDNINLRTPVHIEVEQKIDSKKASDTVLSAEQVYHSLLQAHQKSASTTIQNKGVQPLITNSVDKITSVKGSTSIVAEKAPVLMKGPLVDVSKVKHLDKASEQVVPVKQPMTQPHIPQPNGFKLPDKPWRSDQFEKLNGLDLYVRNSFYDKRNDRGQKLIRIWAINPLKVRDNIYCHVLWIRKYNVVELKVIQGYLRIQDSSVRPFCKYFTGVIECPWNETFVPKYVSISPSRNVTLNQWHAIRHINLPEKRPKKVGICMKTLFDYDDDSVGPLMEWFELNKLLGVDKVIMYSYDNVSTNAVKLLNHYKNSGFLSLKSWKLPMKTYTKNVYKLKFSDPQMRDLVKKTTTNASDVPCVRYHAQHLTYMDCIYDNMHKYNYLIFIDVDEYIVPEQNKTLKDMLEYLDTLPRYEHTASFVFEEACFANQAKQVAKNFTRMTLLSQNYTRGPITSDHKAMKSVIRPRFVKNMHIHR